MINGKLIRILQIGVDFTWYPALGYNTHRASTFMYLQCGRKTHEDSFARQYPL